jgi:hypothetical protein
MTEDLEMTGDDYNVALFTFFITYILFEVRLPPSHHLDFSVTDTLLPPSIQSRW